MCHSRGLSTLRGITRTSPRPYILSAKFSEIAHGRFGHISYKPGSTNGRSLLPLNGRNYCRGGFQLIKNLVFYRLSSTVSEPRAFSIKDEAHPSLYYHLMEPPPDIHGGRRLFALSLLEERPVLERSQTILGWLPALGPGQESGLNDFVASPSFLEIFHEAIQEGLAEDEVWINGAIQTQSGWMHVFDQRNPPPLGRIPDPDDIIASVRVEDSKMLLDTYQAMPSYRICTSDGVCQLTETLLRTLQAKLREIARQERSIV